MDYADDGPESPSVGPQSPRVFSSIRSKNSSYNENHHHHSGELVPSNSTRRNSTAGPAKPGPVLLKEHPMLQDANAAPSPTSHSALPPVHISSSSNSNSFTNKGAPGQSGGFGGVPGAPPNLNALMSPSSGRRKSTPAALDMVLRTAEGKAAVEQLLQPSGGQNKLVFGNYFAGTSAAARDQAAAQAAAEKLRLKAAAGAAGAGGMGSPMGMGMPPKYPAAGAVQLPPPAAVLAAALTAKPQGLAGLQVPHGSGNFDALAVAAMATVPEDVAMEDAPVPQAQHHKKQPADSVSSLQEESPPSSHVAKAGPPPAAHVLQQPAPAAVSLYQQQQQQHHALPPQLQQPHQQVMQQHVQAPPTPQEEVPSMSNRLATKLISLSPQLPANMQRKHWHLADYNIIRKMYTGYASTVYQVRARAQAF